METTKRIERADELVAAITAEAVPTLHASVWSKGTTVRVYLRDNRGDRGYLDVTEAGTVEDRTRGYSALVARVR